MEDKAMAKRRLKKEGHIPKEEKEDLERDG
jgi:hypothetical protein